MEHLNQIIGENLKRLRAERGLSLDAASSVTGVSKSLLGQIERGEANPTISTVWRIARGLSVAFTTLVTPVDGGSEVVRRADIDPVSEDDGRVRNYPVVPFDASLGFEVSFIEVDPGGTLEADPHAGGTQELITVVAGELSIRVADDEHELAAGDSIRFRADVPHAYRNDGSGLAVFTMVIAYARGG